MLSQVCILGLVSCDHQVKKHARPSFPEAVGGAGSAEGAWLTGTANETQPADPSASLHPLPHPCISEESSSTNIHFLKTHINAPTPSTKSLRRQVLTVALRRNVRAPLVTPRPLGDIRAFPGPLPAPGPPLTSHTFQKTSAQTSEVERQRKTQDGCDTSRN